MPVVNERGQAAVLRCSDRHPLHRVRPISHAVVHLPTRQHDLDRTFGHACAKRGQRDVRPRAQAGPERAAHERRHDANVLGRHAEHRGDFLRYVVHPLRLVPQGESIAVPCGDRRVHLDRIVVFAGDHVPLVDLHVRTCQCSLRVAASRLRRTLLALVGFLLRGHHHLGARNVGDRSLRPVGDPYEAHRMHGLLERLRDDEPDGLALVRHAIVLEDVKPLTHFGVHRSLVRSIGQLGGVAVREHRDHTRRTLGERRVDGQSPACDRAAKDRSVGDIRLLELRRIRRRPGRLLAAIDATDRLPHVLRRHVRVPAVSTARTIARCMSSILKSLRP